MEHVLIALTAVSLAASVVFGVVTWRTVARERRRSAERVAALAAVLDAGERVSMAGVEDSRPVPVASLFDAKPGSTVKGRPLIRGAVIAVLGLTLIVFAAMSSRDHAVQPISPHNPAPLELVSMTHRREGRTLTVSGMVRNPHAGMPLTQVEALVLAFDRSGSVTAQGMAPLDFRTLQPGDESSFVVAVAGAADVSRYRVSFRTGTSVLRHVDRRTQSQLAVVR